MNTMQLVMVTQFTLSELDSRFNFTYDYNSKPGTVYLYIDIFNETQYIMDILEGKRVESLVEQHIKPLIPYSIQLETIVNIKD